MLKALAEMHPQISEALKIEVDASDEKIKARTLFSGMFERGAGSKNVQKGRFGQTLAYLIREGGVCIVPAYIEQAIRHVCPGAAPDPMPAEEPEGAPVAPVEVPGADLI